MAADLLIRNARVFGRGELVDVSIVGGRIAEISPCGVAASIAELDARGGLVAPGLVNGHAHLDKALTADRLHGPPGDLRTRAGLEHAIEAMRAIKRAFTVEDVRERVIRAARLAARWGTTLLRTHVDVDPIVGLTSVRGVLEAKEACAAWVDIQVVAFPQEGIFRAPGTEALLREALQLGADAIGGIPALDDRPSEHVDLIFRLALEYGRPIDMHVDESDRPEDFTLPYVIERARHHRDLPGIAVGHISSLTVQPDKVAHEAIAALAEAGISVSVNPIIVKITRLRELLDAGVNVMYGTDNIRDPFYPLGDGSPLTAALRACELAGLATERDLSAAFGAVTENARRALGREPVRLAVGSPADLVAFEAPAAAEAILDQRPPRFVVKAGRLLAT